MAASSSKQGRYWVEIVEWRIEPSNQGSSGCAVRRHEAWRHPVESMHPAERIPSQNWLPVVHRLQVIAFIRKLGRKLSKAQRLKIFKKWDWLQSQINAFNHRATAYWLQDKSVFGDDFADFTLIPELFDPIEGEEYSAPSLSTDQPERAPILLPLQFGKDTLNHPAIIPFVKQEIKLREGQANDALDGLRLALSRKSVLFRTDLQHTKTKKGKSQSWAEINKVSRTARHFTQLYRFACQRLEQLSAPSATMKWYQPLEKEHLNVTTMVIDLALRGTHNQSLAWFWTIDVQGDIGKVDGMAECKWSIQWHNDAWLMITQLIYKSTTFIGWRQKLREINGRRKRECCFRRWSLSLHSWSTQQVFGRSGRCLLALKGSPVGQSVMRFRRLICGKHLPIKHGWSLGRYRWWQRRKQPTTRMP